MRSGNTAVCEIPKKGKFSNVLATKSSGQAINALKKQERRWSDKPEIDEWRSSGPGFKGF
jgi:hypothetical protein